MHAETEKIVAFGRKRVATEPEYSNIASPIGLAQYAAIAAEVARVIGRGRVLDWGAGWGQASLLLRAHGLDAVAFDVEDKAAKTGLLVDTEVPYVLAGGPGLPFADGAFDGVLNCGVLEHVEDPAAALAELRRILRPGGWLFTYHLPNRHAYTEWLGRRLGRFYHERTYRRTEATALFEGAGFRVDACRPFHLLPRNVWGRLRWPAALASPPVRLYEALDAALLRIPGLAWLATAWAVRVRRVD